MTAVTLMVVLAMGTIAANANTGILVGDRSEPCTTNNDTKIDVGGVLESIVGIIVVGRDGIIVVGRDGIIVVGKGSNSCQQQRDGVLLAD